MHTSANRALTIQPVGEPWPVERQRDLSRETVYRQWVAVAELYASFLQGPLLVQSKQAPGASRGNGILTLRIDDPDQASLDQALESAYHSLQAGDMLVIDVPGPIGTQVDFGLQRDLVSRALFKGGFERPMIWAGRRLLEAENRCSLFNRFLPSSALGAGPHIIRGIREPLEPLPEQSIVIARRSALAPPSQRSLRLSVVMPVYNEKKTFSEVMEALLAKTIPGFEIEICVVESNSADGTRADVLHYASHPRVRLLLEDKPLGKGHAVRRGVELASGDVILIQDADFEYDLGDYEKLLDPIRRLETSFVLGSRHSVTGNGWRIRHFSEQPGLSGMMNVGHLFFTWFLNTMFRQQLRDPFTMYKVFRRDCINNIHFECNRFDFDHELVGKLIRNGFRPLEIGVNYSSRSFDEGKKVSIFGDPPTWIRACVLHRFSQLYVWPEHL